MEQHRADNIILIMLMVQMLIMIMTEGELNINMFTGSFSVCLIEEINFSHSGSFLVQHNPDMTAVIIIPHIIIISSIKNNRKCE